MLLQVEYLLLEVLSSVWILEQGGECGVLCHSRLLLREKRRETGVHIMEVAAKRSLLRKSSMKCLHVRLPLRLTELHQIKVRLLYQVLLILLVRDRSCGNAAELHIRPDAGIVIHREIVGAVYTAEVRPHPLQSVIEAERVVAGGQCRIHNTVIHGWVLGFGSHVEPRQCIRIANELSIFGHLVFDVVVDEC